jgi:hypothetical protein
MKDTPIVDVSIEDHGSIVLLVLLTDAAHAWIIEHVKSESWQWLGQNRLAIEPRYLDALHSGLAGAGFVVEEA